MRNQEKEISLLDMLLYICQRWRLLIICLIIGAVVFGAYGWLKSEKTTADNESNSTSADEIKLETKLTPAEMDYVEQGVEYWNRFLEIQKESENAISPESKEVYISKWTYYTNELDARIKLQKYVKEFSKNQWTYFNFLTNADTEKKENIVTNTSDAKRTIGLKYIVLGALLGLIIAVIILAIKYAVTKTIKTIYDLEEGFGFQVLGVFDNETEFDKKHKTKFDKILRKARKKNKHKLTFDENIELTATKIKIAAEKLNLSNICLNTDIEKDCNLMEAIVNKFSRNLNITVIKNVLAKADALQDMAKMDGAILVEQIEVSTDKDINDECLLCSKYGINIIGAIALE